MANYEAAVAVTYVGFTALIMWLSTKFDKDDLVGGSFKFFLTGVSFFMIWMGVGTARNLASANSAPAGIVSGLGVLYTVLLWTFILMLFIMFLQILNNVFKWAKSLKAKGRVRL